MKIECRLTERRSAPGSTVSDKPASVIERAGGYIPPARGFSLLEVIVVVAIIMIVAAITVEMVQKAAQMMRLEESAITYSGLLQQARIRAVQDDKYYTVLTTTGGNAAPTAFIDIAGTGAYVPGDPMMVFPSGVSPMAFSSGPSLANLEAQFLPPDPSSLLTLNTTAPGPSFGPRGLPCTPTSSGPTGTCPYLTPAGIPTSYLTFLQNGQNGKWEAVTVTPAGRIRQWAYDSGAWSSMN